MIQLMEKPWSGFKMSMTNWKFSETYEQWINLDSVRMIHIEEKNGIYAAYVTFHNGDRVIINMEMNRKDLDNWLKEFTRMPS